MRECGRSRGVTRKCCPAESVSIWPIGLVNPGREDGKWRVLPKTHQWLCYSLWNERKTS